MLAPIQNSPIDNSTGAVQTPTAARPTPSAPPQLDAGAIAKFLQLDAPVQGANYRGISLQTSNSREYEVDRKGVSSATTTQSRQVNVNSSGLKVAVRNEQSVQNTRTGTTLTQTSSRLAQTDNATYGQLTQRQVTNEPKAKTEEKQQKDPTAIQKLYGNTSFNVLNWQPQNLPQGAVASATFSGKAGPASGSVQFSALSYETSASAGVSLQGNALHAQVQGSAGAYLGKVSASGQLNLPAGVDLKADGNAEVGAGVDGTGEAVIDPLHGQVDGTVDASAFVGAKAQGDASIDVGPADTTANGDVGAGLGASVDASVGFDKGKVSFDFGFQAYLGIGGGGNMSVSLDVGAMANDADSAAKDVGHAASDAWHAATSWL